MIPGLRLGEAALLTERVSPPAIAFETQAPRPQGSRYRLAPGGLARGFAQASGWPGWSCRTRRKHASASPGRPWRPRATPSRFQVGACWGRSRIASRNDRIASSSRPVAWQTAPSKYQPCSAGRVHSQGGAVDLLRPDEIARLVEGFALRQRLWDIHQRGPFRRAARVTSWSSPGLCTRPGSRRSGGVSSKASSSRTGGLPFANGAAHVWLLDRRKGAVVLDDGRGTRWPQLRQPKSIGAIGKGNVRSGPGRDNRLPEGVWRSAPRSRRRDRAMTAGCVK